MIEIAEETVISRSPAATWATVSDFGGISRWAPNVDHSCLMSESDLGMGSVRRVQVDRNTLLERIVDWEPDLRLGYSIDGLPPVVRSATTTWRLSGCDETTTVTVTSRVDAGPRPPQRVLARVVGRILARASRQMLQGLKAHLEATTS